METEQSVSLPTTLDPLPPVLRHGLPVVAFFGLLSLASSSCLFLFMTCRLVSWYQHAQIRQGANQFFVLIYNLLVADIQQAMAFALTTVYLVEDKIDVNTTTCRANGFFVSVGDVAQGIFCMAIGLHTALSVVKSHTISDRLFYLYIAACWAFVYLMAIITVTLHPIDVIYTRAGAWCWIDTRFEKERLWLHYIWVFITMFGVVLIYGIIYISIITRLATSTAQETASTAQKKRAAKYMIIYPTIYVVCTLPLAGGRMAAMTGISVPYWYYCLAGAAITSCGWLDVLLYTLTRRALIFPSEPPPEVHYGLNTFGWYGKNSNNFGTTTTIEGPLTPGNTLGRRGHKPSILRQSIWRPLRKRHSDEDYFARPAEGVIMTKTTVEVTRQVTLGYADSATSVIEMDRRSSEISPCGPS